MRHRPADHRRREAARCFLAAACTTGLLTAGAQAAEARGCSGQVATIVGDEKVVHGTGDDDVIVLRGNVDEVFAGAGDDVVCGGRRVGAVHGGSGDDTLSPGKTAYWFQTFGDAGRDLVSVGAHGPDRVKLFGGSGDDRLVGRDTVNAELDGGPGSDFLDGSDGYQWVMFSGAVGITADLAAGYSSGQGDDELIAVESIVGTSGDDVLAGTNDMNRIDAGDGDDVVAARGDLDMLNGGEGDDRISAGWGLDELRGGPGNDHLQGGADYDMFFPGHEDDSIDGGGGDDWIFELEPRRMDARLGNETIDGGEGRDHVVFLSSIAGSEDEPATVDLAEGTASFFGEHAVAGIEDVSVSNGAPVRVVGDASANSLSAGGSGSVVVLGGPGDDDISGGGDVTELDGGDGSDTTSYSAVTGLTVDLMNGTATAPPAAVVRLANFENIEVRCVGDGGSVVLLGDEGPNRIESGCKNDHLEGRGGNDALAGGAGDDFLDGGDGSDSLDGGDGTDRCVNGETSRSCEDELRRATS